MGTGCRVCAMVGRLTGRNVTVVVISDRLPRVVGVYSGIYIVETNRLIKGLKGSRVGRRRVVGCTTKNMRWCR